MDFIDHALQVYNETQNVITQPAETSIINSQDALDKITLLLKDLYYLRLQNKTSYPLNTLLNLLTKNFGFNGFSIEIEQILQDSVKKRYITTVSIILRKDGTSVTGTSSSEKTVKKSITMAIKICILHRFGELYNRHSRSKEM